VQDEVTRTVNRMTLNTLNNNNNNIEVDGMQKGSDSTGKVMHI